MKDQKKALREVMRSQRDSMDPVIRSRLSRDVNALLEDPWYGVEKNILHAFLPMGSEVDIQPFLIDWVMEMKLLITAKVLSDGELSHHVTHFPTEWEKGLYGTRQTRNGEPYEGSYDLILVPGLAFSRSGARLGFGKGYYDRFLKTEPSALKIGVGFPNQLVDEIPEEPHDVRMDVLIMGNQFIDLRKKVKKKKTNK